MPLAAESILTTRRKSQDMQSGSLFNFSSKFPILWSWCLETKRPMVWIFKVRSLHRPCPPQPYENSFLCTSGWVWGLCHLGFVGRCQVSQTGKGSSIKKVKDWRWAWPSSISTSRESWRWKKLGHVRAVVLYGGFLGQQHPLYLELLRKTHDQAPSFKLNDQKPVWSAPSSHSDSRSRLRPSAPRAVFLQPSCLLSSPGKLVIVMPPPIPDQ